MHPPFIEFTIRADVYIIFSVGIMWKRKIQEDINFPEIVLELILEIHRAQSLKINCYNMEKVSFCYSEPI